VRRFDGRTLAYIRTAVSLPRWAAEPEGLCFSKGCMFVARCGRTACMHACTATEQLSIRRINACRLCCM
jgi:hypothetical protein